MIFPTQGWATTMELFNSGIMIIIMANRLFIHKKLIDYTSGKTRLHYLKHLLLSLFSEHDRSDPLELKYVTNME